ncbi:UDP-N-acetylmuramate dehydrogenase [Stomatohabitans albus]|uniref:UDP-N-acetylmuramate dehydrogenase n=1 Tax=Stomatohabitans albus TaxID=3110766 RepID=UPI00300D4EF1
MPELIEDLTAIPNVLVITSRPLSAFTTIGVGGMPRAIVRTNTNAAAKQVLDYLDHMDIPSLVLGGGSNLVIDDGDLDVVAVQLPGSGVRAGDARYTDHVTIDPKSGAITSDAGITWDDLVQSAIGLGLGGLECLSGIPGSVGATPVQNVGAYGVEIAHILNAVLVYDRQTKAAQWIEPEQLDLGYRTSNLKFQDRRIVFAVQLRGNPDGLSAPLRYTELLRMCDAREGERRPSAKVRTAVLAQRRAKGMVYDPHDVDTASAGSFFTNPVVPDLRPVIERVRFACGDDVAERIPVHPVANGYKLSAAWLIERAGFKKGWPENGVATLSTKHSLAITNRGRATTNDVWNLANQIMEEVERTFGIRLHPEPVAYPPRPRPSS